MWYNITFTLGDPSQDGHCITETYHITTTHSADCITNAYKEFVSKYNVDFVTLFSEYECSTTFPEDVQKVFKELGIDDVGYLTGVDDLVVIFFDIIKFMIPDFKWKYRDLEETCLDVLNEKGYGLFWVG